MALQRVGRGVYGAVALCMVWLFRLLAFLRIAVKTTCTGSVCQYSSFPNFSSINQFIAYNGKLYDHARNGHGNMTPRRASNANKSIDSLFHKDNLNNIRR